MTSTSEIAAPKPPNFLFLGGHPAVDFANTIVPPPGSNIEFLQSWQDVIDWLVETELSDGQSLHVSASDPAQALETVRHLRHAWRSTLNEIMAKRGVPRPFIEQLNAILQLDTFTEVLHAESKKGFHLHRAPSLLKGEHLALVILARSMAEFLATAKFKYLRRCANTHTCVLIFYDATKNHRRQWCSNSTCGNRHKVAEFRRRQRNAQRQRI